MRIEKFGFICRVKRLLLLIFMLAILIFQQACAPLQPVELRRAENFHATFDSLPPGFALDLIVYNPNGYGVTITEIATEVSLNDHLVGNISLPQKAHIGRKNESSVRFKMGMTSEQLLTLLPFVSGFFKDDLNGRIRGHIRLKKFLFSKKIPFDLSQKITF